MSPEYLHVVLNHLPLFGLGIGGALLVAGIVRSSDDLRAAAMVVIAVCGLSAWPVAELGEGGYEHVQALSDPEGRQWLKTHEERAEKALPFIYLTAALALGALGAMWKKPGWVKPLSLAVLLFTLFSLRALAWVAQAGGQVRHQEFRAGTP